MPHTKWLREDGTGDALALPAPAVTTSFLLQHDFLVMMWIKPAVVLHALRQGYAAMFVGERQQPANAP